MVWASLWHQAASADSLSMRATQYNQENILTVFGSTDITDEVSLNAEIDSTGYLSLGGGYGIIKERWYLEGFTNYGRADSVDIIDLGALIVRNVSTKINVHLVSYHQWRNTATIFESNLLDQREWNNTIGISFDPVSWFDISLSASYDILLSGERYINKVENKSINSQDITLNFKPGLVELFIRYTTGEHRVRPGEPITKDDTWEVGVSGSF